MTHGKPMADDIRRIVAHMKAHDIKPHRCTEEEARRHNEIMIAAGEEPDLKPGDLVYYPEDLMGPKKVKD